MIPVSLYPSLRSWLVRWEGYTDYWYLDSGGVPTIGIGLASLQAPAQDLYGDGTLDAWTAVLKEKPGYLAENYAHATPWRANEALLERVFQTNLLYFYGAAIARFEGFVGCPQPAQIGSLDLYWNCGSLRKWPKFSAAFERRDWATCAVECIETEGKPDPHRNVARRDLFLSLTGTSSAP